ARLDSLSAPAQAAEVTLEPLRAELTGLREEIDELGTKLAGPLGIQGVAQAIEELPGRIGPPDLSTDLATVRELSEARRESTIEHVSDDAFAEEMAGLRQAVARVAEQVSGEELRSELAALSASLSGPRGTQGIMQAIEELQRNVPGAGVATDLDELRTM